MVRARVVSARGDGARNDEDPKAGPPKAGQHALEWSHDHGCAWAMEQAQLCIPLLPSLLLQQCSCPLPDFTAAYQHNQALTVFRHVLTCSPQSNPLHAIHFPSFAGSRLLIPLLSSNMELLHPMLNPLSSNMSAVHPIFDYVFIWIYDLAILT